MMVRFLLGVGGSERYGPRYNAAPGQWIPAILGSLHDDNQGTPVSRLGQLKWGLVPSWASDEKSGNKPVNLRAETVADKLAFRQLLSRKRCLIPADGFYEWEKTGSKKQPVRFTMNDRSLFGMAALYDTWLTLDGSKLHTCAIITVPANGLVARIHPRMPAILQPEHEAVWLNRSITGPERLIPLLEPFSEQRMTAYEVDPKVGKVDYDAPDCIDALNALL
jgi:putative SOS response-associated peptidase YedK